MLEDISKVTRGKMLWDYYAKYKNLQSKILFYTKL